MLARGGTRATNVELLGACRVGALQFILFNSQLGGFQNPGVSYLGMGAIDYLGQELKSKGLQAWGYMASDLGMSFRGRP